MAIQYDTIRYGMNEEECRMTVGHGEEDWQDRGVELVRFFSLCAKRQRKEVGRLRYLVELVTLLPKGDPKDDPKKRTVCLLAGRVCFPSLYCII